VSRSFSTPQVYKDLYENPTKTAKPARLTWTRRSAGNSASPSGQSSRDTLQLPFSDTCGLYGLVHRAPGPHNRSVHTGLPSSTPLFHAGCRARIQLMTAQALGESHVLLHLPLISRLGFSFTPSILQRKNGQSSFVFFCW
jgi:hypothetical protein